MSLRLFGEFVFNDPEYADGGTPTYTEFDDCLHDPTAEKNRPSTGAMWDHAMDISSLFDLLFECSIRVSVPVEQDSLLGTTMLSRTARKV